MDGYGSSGDKAECRRRARSDAPRKRGARRWLNRGSRPPAAFERRKLVKFERELGRRCRHASSGSSAAGSSSAGASSSRLTPVKREPEELGPCTVKLEADAPLRRGVIGPEDYLHPEQEEHLECVVLERSAWEQEEAEGRCHQTGVAASQAHASKEADLRFMKAEQAKFFIDLDCSGPD